MELALAGDGSANRDPRVGKGILIGSCFYQYHVDPLGELVSVQPTAANFERCRRSGPETDTGHV